MMETSHVYIGAIEVFVLVVGMGVALARAFSIDDRHRKTVLLIFSVFLFGSALRDSAVLVWDASNHVWNQKASYLSLFGKNVQLASILGWVGVSTYESCKHWLWSLMLFGGIMFAVLWDIVWP